MNFFKGLVELLGSKLPDSSLYNSQQNPSSSSNTVTTMDGGTVGTSITNERVAYKLRGYFDLAKEEIDKAVRAEEWGLVDEAIVHYKTAQRILVEGSLTPVPSYISPSERLKVNSYRQKILKWQGQVSDRLEVLTGRIGGSSTKKDSWMPVQPATVSSKPLNARKDLVRKSSGLSRQSSGVRIQTDKIVNSDPPVQDLGHGCDPKLVEMINTAIVDRSPSVKWEDVGEAL